MIKLNSTQSSSEFRPAVPDFSKTRNVPPVFRPVPGFSNHPCRHAVANESQGTEPGVSNVTDSPQTTIHGV